MELINKFNTRKLNLRSLNGNKSFFKNHACRFLLSGSLDDELLITDIVFL